MQRKDIEQGLWIDKDVNDVLFEGSKKRKEKKTAVPKEGELQVSMVDEGSQLVCHKDDVKKLLNKQYVPKEGDDKDEDGNTVDEEEFYKRQYKTHENFVRKVYGIFTCQLIIMVSYIMFVLSRAKANKEKMSKEDWKTKKDETFQNMGVMIGAIVLGIICVFGILNKKARRTNYLNHTIALLFTLSLSYPVGYLVYKVDFNTVLLALILTVVLSLTMAFLGAHMVKIVGWKNENKVKNSIGPTFGALGIMVVVIILISIFLDIGAMKGVWFFLAATVAFFYMFIDIWAITSGKYDKMITTDDAVYASCKLFADFVLGFVLIVKMLTGDC